MTNQKTFRVELVPDGSTAYWRCVNNTELTNTKEAHYNKDFTLRRNTQGKIVWHPYCTGVLHAAAYGSSDPDSEQIEIKNIRPAQVGHLSKYYSSEFLGAILILTKYRIINIRLFYPLATLEVPSEKKGDF